jgi:hypothetical protein
MAGQKINQVPNRPNEEHHRRLFEVQRGDSDADCMSARGGDERLHRNGAAVNGRVGEAEEPPIKLLPAHIVPPLPFIFTGHRKKTRRPKSTGLRLRTGGMFGGILPASSALSRGFPVQPEACALPLTFNFVLVVFIFAGLLPFT